VPPALLGASSSHPTCPHTHSRPPPPHPAGKGTLAQLGFESPSPELLTVLLALTTAGVVVGSANTANRLINKKMTPRCVGRPRAAPAVRSLPVVGGSRMAQQASPCRTALPPPPPPGRQVSMYKQLLGSNH